MNGRWFSVELWKRGKLQVAREIGDLDGVLKVKEALKPFQDRNAQGVIFVNLVTPCNLILQVDVVRVDIAGKNADNVVSAILEQREHVA